MIKNLKLGTLGAAFVIALLLSGGLLVTSELVTMNNVADIKSTWDTFEAGRSEKARALSALRKEIGYGGMIHQFKNFVLREDHQRVGLINQKLGGAISAVANYRALGVTAEETVALDDIAAALGDYGAALATALELASRGRTPNEIDQVVKVDDGLAIRGLDVLDAEVTRITQSYSSVESKSQVVASLRKAMGYGGMIHRFKNFVLRRDPEIGDAVLSDIASAREALGRYAERNLTTAEVGAISDIGGVVDAYETALGKAGQLAQVGTSPLEIDRAVKVSDGPALIGFDTLTREIALESAGEARKVNQVLMFVSSLVEIAAWVGLSVTLVLILAAVWIFRTQIIGPITKMTSLMSRLAAGDLELQIHAAEQTNEIGEMARAVEIFKENAIERRRVEKVKGEFVSTVSHELRTPLTSIKGSLGLARSGAIGELSGKLESMIDIAYNNSDRLVRLINDILDVDKISAGKMEFRMESIDVGELLDQALVANKAFGEEHNVTFQLDKQADNARVSADQDRLMQVLANLMSNACKYSPDGGVVKIRLVRRSESYRISVADQGAGIPDEFQDKVFERFSQADSSDTRLRGGTGLGLNITKAIVEQHGGAIGFNSKVGIGTTFYVDLPALRDKSPGQRPAGENAADQEFVGKPRILHVEDDEDVLEVVLAMVGKRANVFSAQSYDEASRLLSRERYDLVILDLMLPDQDGENLIPLIQTSNDNPSPIIVFSAKDTTVEIRKQVLAAFVKSRTSNDVLSKSILSVI